MKLELAFNKKLTLLPTNEKIYVGEKNISGIDIVANFEKINGMYSVNDLSWKAVVVFGDGLKKTYPFDFSDNQYQCDGVIPIDEDITDNVQIIKVYLLFENEDMDVKGLTNTVDISVNAAPDDSEEIVSRVELLNDLNTVRSAIIDKGVEVPEGTDPSEYGALIGSIPEGAAISEDYDIDGTTLRKANVDLDTDYTAVIPDGIEWIGEQAFDGSYVPTEITIPASVSSIGSRAFADCKRLRTIAIPSGVTQIAENTFYGCEKLEGVTIPDTVTSIGYGAFARCTSLEEIHISSVDQLGEQAFHGCHSLTDIWLSDDLAIIGEGAFYDCPSLPAFDVPNQVTEIGNQAFAGCRGLEEVNIPNAVATIGEAAFETCENLERINIPEALTEIKNSTFHSCESLTEILIPDLVTTIGDFAFFNCAGLESIVIPAGVTSMGIACFANCQSLTDIYFKGTQAQWEAIDGLANAGIDAGVTIHYEYVVE